MAKFQKNQSIAPVNEISSKVKEISSSNDDSPQVKGFKEKKKAEGILNGRKIG